MGFDVCRRKGGALRRRRGRAEKGRQRGRAAAAAGERAHGRAASEPHPGFPSFTNTFFFEEQEKGCQWVTKNAPDALDCSAPGGRGRKGGGSRLCSSGRARRPQPLFFCRRHPPSRPNRHALSSCAGVGGGGGGQERNWGAKWVKMGRNEILKKGPKAGGGEKARREEPPLAPHPPPVFEKPTKNKSAHNQQTNKKTHLNRGTAEARQPTQPQPQKLKLHEPRDHLDQKRRERHTRVGRRKPRKHP